MCKLNRRLKKYALFLLFFLSLFVLGLAIIPLIAKAEPIYRMSESELIRLQQICGRLEVLNKQLLLELNASKKSLTELQNELNNYKAELTALSQQLEQSKAESTELLTEQMNASALLAKTQASFELYKIEVQRKIKRLTRQRNISIAGLIISLIL